MVHAPPILSRNYLAPPQLIEKYFHAPPGIFNTNKTLFYKYQSVEKKNIICRARNRSKTTEEVS
jgi:ribosomal protein S17E